MAHTSKTADIIRYQRERCLNFQNDEGNPGNHKAKNVCQGFEKAGVDFLHIIYLVQKMFSWSSIDEPLENSYTTQ